MADAALSTLPSKHRWWPRIAWTKRNRIIAAGSGVLLIVVAAGLAAAMWWPASPEPAPMKTVAATPTPTPTPAPKDHPDPLNGVMYTASDAAVFANRRPVAVMVENHVDARPQSGINDAEVLYEAMAEGGITRFMAVYLANQPGKIGPVRSARLHYVSWAAEYDAVYAHWGGSAEALDYVHSHHQPLNLDEFNFAGAFYRDMSGHKALEHTGYTSMASLRKVVQQQGWEQSSNFSQWAFKDDATPDKRPQAQTVSLGFEGTAGYDAKFEYRPDTNDYARWTGGQPHVDATGTQLTAKTIVLQFQQVTNYKDSNGHAAVRVTTTGSGKAVVIEDGTSVEGTWSKPDFNSRTTFSDANGQTIPFDRGKIWVISVPVGSSVSY